MIGNMSNENELLESLKCPVCIDYADDPMECHHCSNIYCKKCLGVDGNTYKIKKCPMCRNDSNFRESTFAKKLLNNLPISCPENCGATLSKADLSNHLQKCPKKKYICNICNLDFIRQDFLTHVNSKHEDEIFDRFCSNLSNKSILEPPSNLKSTIILGSNNTSSQNTCLSYINGNMVNRKGDIVKKGNNGLFYCGKKSFIYCGCCDGNCGPDNGCCCVHCMELNCRNMNLPKGFLVNNKGLPCAIDRDFYRCGAEFQKETKNIFQIVFNKKVKCQYPNCCPDCEKLTSLKNVYKNI